MALSRIAPMLPASRPLQRTMAMGMRGWDFTQHKSSCGRTRVTSSPQSRDRPSYATPYLKVRLSISGIPLSRFSSYEPREHSSRCQNGPKRDRLASGSRGLASRVGWLAGRAANHGRWRGVWMAGRNVAYGLGALRGGRWSMVGWHGMWSGPRSISPDEADKHWAGLVATVVLGLVHES